METVTTIGGKLCNRANYKKIGPKLLSKSFSPYLCTPFRERRVYAGDRELSSVGSEHLPYKQRVGGSRPSAPTDGLREIGGFFVFRLDVMVLQQQPG